MFAPHLPWRDDPVRARLARRWGTTVVLDNDANCAARAEVGVRRGARERLRRPRDHPRHRHRRRGGARAARGARPQRDGRGVRPHAGWCRTGGRASAGGRGCWEQYCSGNALVRLARARVGRSRRAGRGCAAGDPARLTGPMVTAAAEAGDLVARQAFAVRRRLARRRRGQPGRGARPGGGRRRRRGVRGRRAAARAGPRRPEPRAGRRRAPRRTPAVRARFGPEAGVVGAARMAARATLVTALSGPRPGSEPGRRRPRGRVARAASAPPGRRTRRRTPATSR